MQSITEADYENILDDENPIVLLFWADWNQTSREMVGVIEALEPEFERKINFYKMNIDSNKSLCDRLGVRGVPYMLLFFNRVIVQSISGSVEIPELRKTLDLFLARLM